MKHSLEGSPKMASDEAAQESYIAMLEKKDISSAGNRFSGYGNPEVKR